MTRIERGTLGPLISLGAWLNQDIRKNARINQAMITSIGKTQVKAQKQAMKVFALPKSILSDQRSMSQTVATLPSGIPLPVRRSTFRCLEPIPECPATAGQQDQPYESDDDAGLG